MTDLPGSPERWQRIRELFETGLSIDSEQRTQWLAKECGGDDDLRETMDGLLAAARASTEIIDVTINEASESFLHNLHCAPPGKPAKDAAQPINEKTRRAFACLEAFFYHSARSGQDTNPARAGIDAGLAKAFGRAANGHDSLEPAAQIKRLLAQLEDGHESRETLTAIRFWLQVLEDDAGTDRGRRRR